MEAYGRVNRVADIAEKLGAVTHFECWAPTLDGATITLRYGAQANADTIFEFTETIQLPAPLPAATTQVVEPLLRLLSLAGALSYFKAFAPTQFHVPAGLTAAEHAFAAALLRHGLGEFAYVNDLPEVLATTIVAPNLDSTPHPSGPSPDSIRDGEQWQRALVAVGGGKDSIVSIEALKNADLELGLFSVNSYAPIEATARVAELPLHTARRKLDPLLFELNAAGAPNGHVPITAINSLTGLLTAIALRFDAVVFSNEASSSYGNFTWHDVLINHQWSKSLDFERLLRATIPSGSPGYVSLLRPLTELRIARRFATHTHYHPVFTSCNRAFKLDDAERTSWCADCPKCRFVYLCLAPFMSRDQLLAIFGGRDLFADPTQLTGFLELLGVDELVKPFECVGEPDECRVALQLLRTHPDWADHPFLALPQIVPITATAAEQAQVFAFRPDHCLAEPLLGIAHEI